MPNHTSFLGPPFLGCIGRYRVKRVLKNDNAVVSHNGMGYQGLCLAITKQGFEKVVRFVEAEVNCLLSRGGNGEITPAAHHHPIMILI